MTTQKSDMPELLPCPFCGGRAFCDTGNSDYENVCCVNDLCDLNSIFMSPKKWNTRAVLAKTMDVESALDFLDKIIAAPYATYTSISRKQLKNLRQVIAAQGLVGAWQPIETAPKKEGNND